ncbi:MAG: tetratricopeptide repeat protein, partial [Myxococcota bacterium]
MSRRAGLGALVVSLGLLGFPGRPLGAGFPVLLLGVGFEHPASAASADRGTATEAPPDRLEGPVPVEVDAFRATQDRFSERMKELEDDTRSFVNFREQEERAAVAVQYTDRIEQLVGQEKEQREGAIVRFEAFLDRYPELPYASHVRFRLAELWFEKASEEWLAEADEYNARLNDPNTPIEQLEALGEEPKRDLSRSLELYQKIVADNRYKPADTRYERLDGTYLMMGFVYNDVNSVQYDPAMAKATFQELIQVLPDSELADRAHLFLGNFAFEENQFDAALAEYNFVYGKGVEGKYFEEALYQLAWARYKMNEFDRALTLFTELLDLSEKKKVDSGTESPFAPDARRFMAFSFADIAYDDDSDAVNVAKAYFKKIGEREYEREVYRQLADVLIRYTRPREAIEAYALLQEDPRWILESDDPKYQIALIDLYLTSIARDLAAAGSARLEFIDKYSEGTPWWDANRNDPEALEVARQYIESSLLDVAIEYRVRAQESGQPGDFSLAADKYEEYLEKFPISDDYYKQQWYLADSLKLAGDYDRALVEFESLVRNARYHPYGDAAMYSLMDVRLQRMSALGHAPDKEPTDAPVERTYPAGDQTVTVFGLTEDRKKFIESADMVLNHPFTVSTDPELPNYQAAVDERRAALMYVTSQILYYHHRYDEARPRFESLIEKYPRTIEANYAAGLLVDSYLAEGKLAEVRSYSKKFTLNPPGPATDIDPTRFSGTLEATTFKLAMEQAGTADPRVVADSFIAFRKEFPKSEFAPDALYNAAFYNQQAGRAEDANRLYEQFVAEYPQDKRSKGLYFRIAANYEATFELDKAIGFYDKVLGHRDATAAEKADALYNRSFLLIGLGRHREAAQGYERYEAEYDQEDQEQILFLAGEQWEKVSTSDAVEFYGRYKKKYPNASPDHFIEAEYRLLKLYGDQKADATKLKKQNDAIIAAFDRFAQQGKPIGPKGHEYAAAAEYPSLEKAFGNYADDKLSGNDTKDATLLNETKPKELKDIEGRAKAFVAKYQNFEYNSGALLLQAKAALYLADLGLSIRCPKGMSEEDCWTYEDILDEKVFPQFYEVEDVGIKRLQELVQGAKDKKRHSRFVDEAMAELNRRKPDQFPAVKQELEGGTDSTMPVSIPPHRIEAAAPAPAPEPVPPPA